MGPPSDRELPGFLRTMGFRVVGQTRESTLLESDKFRVRYKPEQGPLSAQLASKDDPDRWWNAEQVLAAVAGNQPHQDPKLTELAASLKEQHPMLARMMAAGFRQNMGRTQAAGRSADPLRRLESNELRQLPNQLPTAAPTLPPEFAGSQPESQIEQGFKRLLYAALVIAVLVLIYFALRR